MEESNDTNRTANAQLGHFYCNIDNCSDNAMYSTNEEDDDDDDIEGFDDVNDDDIDCESSFYDVSGTKRRESSTDDFYYYNENMESSRFIDKTSDNDDNDLDSRVVRVTRKKRKYF